MADSQSALPECDLHLDEDEPEEEDQRRRSQSGGTSNALIVKPPPLRPAVNPMADSPEQYLAGQERVYPWVATDPGAVSVILDSAMMTSTTLRATAVQLEPGPRGQKTVTTALLAGSSQSVYRRSESALGYGTNIAIQRTHSILRMSASATSSGHGLRKSASVEFVLDHVHQHKDMAQSIHASTSSIGREPRRLTFEEKTELYRVRPDLEIGPAPFYNEKMEEQNRRNQRRIIFAMFGGMISIVLLLVFFSMWEQTK